MNLTQPTGRPNFHMLRTKNWTVWFSYETPIAVARTEEHVYVSKNEWGSTTGKHINHIKWEYNFEQVPHAEILNLIDLYIQ